MSDIDDLVPWLRVQIAETRALAQRCIEDDEKASRYDESRILVTRLNVGYHDDARFTVSTEEHASLRRMFDPAAALSQCEAHEAILREHRPYDEWLRDEFPDWAPSAERSCVGCGFDNQEERRTSDVNECPTLRALALGYQHRPGYIEEWRP